MLAIFQKYYQEEKLFKPTEKILLTVSGGKDSMTMLHLFETANLDFGVAHCNFKLRGEEANNDEIFVQQYCKTHQIDCYVNPFNTKEFAQEKGISIQMAARELRYAWFEKIRKENNYHHIATAHHKNDVAETMLINLTKGTGLAGLHGISNKKGFVIRPLLCFDSAEISRYAADNHIKFREDASNTDTKYIRNAIRHQVIPTLEEVNPSFIATIVASSQQFLELEEILNQKIETEKNSLFVPNKTGFKIDIEALKKLTPLKTYLYYFLKPFNFNAAIVLAIIKGLDAQSGLVFYSATHQIVKDRTHLLLHEITANETKELEIKSLHELPFNYELAKNNVNFTPKRTSNFAYLDIDKLQFPLLLRTWKEGDYFQPFGMQGTRKVSDFLIDNKVSMVDKKSVKVLISAGKIVWLVGHRIDHKYSILDTTKTILTLSVKEE